MKVYKFGGASVKNAKAVINLKNIVKSESNSLVIVVSAMDKTTNFLENLHMLAYAKESFQKEFDELCRFHQTIITDLFGESKKLDAVDELLASLERTLTECYRFSKDFTYAQIVSFGELLSTSIISSYLNDQSITNTFIDIRKCVQTDNTWREGVVNWEFTKLFVQKYIKPELDTKIVVTQGFIGADPDGHTTTLGREGSDFSAAILASCLNAVSVTVWKDVPGILTADPKIFDSAKKIDSLTYRDTVEMAYYGASVIHPKTIKPLSEKNIPLFVRSFIDPELDGTSIQDGNELSPSLPSLILKTNQCLITFTNKDLSFSDELSIGEVLHFLSRKHIKINLIQSSATSFSVCIDFDQVHVNHILSELNEQFTIQYNNELQLLTIKNYSDHDFSVLDNIVNKLYLEQKTRNNLRILYR